jgi:hypothetical protein
MKRYYPYHETSFGIVDHAFTTTRRCVIDLKLGYDYKIA